MRNNQEPVPWNADGDIDIPDTKDKHTLSSSLPPLPSGVPVIPYNNLGHREHPDPDGEYCAIPLSDETYSYQGKRWAPRGEWPYRRKEPEPIPPGSNALSNVNIETLKALRALIDQVLAERGEKY